MRAGALSLAFCLLVVATPPPTLAEEDGPYHFAVGKMLAAEGSWRDALDAFDKAIAAEPDDAYLRIEVAELFYRMRRMSDAAEQARAARDLAPDSVDVLRTFGQVYMALAGSDPSALDTAREALEKLRTKTPEDATSMLSLAQVYSAARRLDEAVEVVEELVSYHPNNRRLNGILVETLERAGRYERAQEVLEEIVRLDAEALESRLRLAGIHSKKENHSAAIELLRSAGPEIAVEPRLRGLLAHELFRRATSPGIDSEQRSKDIEEALDVVDGLLREDPSNRSAQILRAEILIETGEYDQARALLKRLRRQAPEDISIAVMLAQVLEQEGEAAAAVELLDGLSRELGVKEGGDQVRLHLAGLHARQSDWEGVVRVTGLLLDSIRGELRDGILGLHLDALVRLERYDKALESVKREEKREGASASLLLRRAEILAAADRLGEVGAILERDLVLGDDSPGSVLRRAHLLFTLERAPEADRLLADLASDGSPQSLIMVGQAYLSELRYGGAIPYLRRALAPGDLPAATTVELNYWLGMAHERSTQYDQAAQYFKAVLELDANHTGALNYLGYMWAERGMHLEEALGLVERAVSLDPDNGAFVDSLGWAHFQLGQYEEAQRHLEKAAELVPDDPTVLEHLGDLYVAVGDLGLARQAYERALKINSEENVEQVRRKLGEL